MRSIKSVNYFLKLLLFFVMISVFSGCGVEDEQISSSESTPIIESLTVYDTKGGSSSSLGTIVISESGSNDIDSFVIIEDDMNDLFDISASGVITTNQVDLLDDNVSLNEYKFRTYATNESGKSNIVNVAFYLSRLPILEQEIDLHVLENSSIGTPIGQIKIENNSTIFKELPVTKMITSGSGFDLFRCSADGVITVNGKLDYETKKSYEFYVVASNAKGESNSTKVNIYVDNAVDNTSVLNKVMNVHIGAEPGSIFGKILLDNIGDSLVGGFSLAGADSQYFTMNSDGEMYLNVGDAWKLGNNVYPDLQFVATNTNGEQITGAITINTFGFKAATSSYVHYGRLDGAYSGERAEDMSISGDIIAFGHGNGIGDTGKFAGDMSILKYNYDLNVYSYIFSDIQPYETQLYDSFGGTLHYDGDFIIASAPYAYGDGRAHTDSGGSGVAYLYELRKDSNESYNLHQVLKYLPSDDGSYRYGYSVYIEDDLIALTNDAGLYLYTLNRGTGAVNSTDVLAYASSGLTTDPHGGEDVVIENDYILVGEMYADQKELEPDNPDAVYRPGAVSMYKYFRNSNTLKHLRYIFADAPVEDSMFGGRVVMQDDYIIISDQGQLDGNEIITKSTESYVHVFKMADDGTVKQVQRLSGMTTQMVEKFGECILLADDMLFVGAAYADDYSYDDGNKSPGGLYIYNLNSATSRFELRDFILDELQNYRAFDAPGKTINVNGTPSALGYTKGRITMLGAHEEEMGRSLFERTDTTMQHVLRSFENTY